MTAAIVIPASILVVAFVMAALSPLEPLLRPVFTRWGMGDEG